MGKIEKLESYVLAVMALLGLVYLNPTAQAGVAGKDAAVAQLGVEPVDSDFKVWRAGGHDRSLVAALEKIKGDDGELSWRIHVGILSGRDNAKLLAENSRDTYSADEPMAGVWGFHLDTVPYRIAKKEVAFGVMSAHTTNGFFDLIVKPLETRQKSKNRIFVWTGEKYREKAAALLR